MESHAAGNRRLALLGTVVLMCAVPSAVAAWPAIGEGQARADDAHVAPGPSSEPRIGSITIEVFDVFDTTARGESYSLARAANNLHPRTRPHVVRREL